MAVAGNPVLHSLSPVLMNRAIVDNKLNGRYLRMPLKNAGQAIEIFKNLPLKAMNITAPFKRDIIPFSDILTPNALKAEAVNCIYRNAEGKIVGHNTDITGVELSLKKFPQHLDYGKMIVLGSGGAVPAVIIAGQNLGLKVTVAARNTDSLLMLKNRFDVETISYDNIENVVKQFKIIVSALPSGVTIFDPEILSKDCTVLDANYDDSVFEKAKIKTGFNFISGKNWLVNQAVPGFEAFTGYEADTDNLYNALDNNDFKFQNRISLCGFMGVGKTTCGKKLAEKLGFDFVDLDQEIELRENLSIKEIFSLKGESYFRDLEEKILISYSDKQNIVLSCGGGTVMNKNNRAVLKHSFLNLWLYASAEYCLEGLDISNRPLLQCENPLQAAKDLLTSRLESYADSAFAIIYTEGMHSDETVDFIYEQINRTFGL